MKTFLTYHENAYGYSFGTMKPAADLNAQSEKEIKKSDLDQVEKYADRIFAKLGIDVEFTRHFLDRVNDVRNQKQISMAELTRLFKQQYKKNGKKIAQLGPGAEAVMKDMQTDVNMPFALVWDKQSQELDLIAKTVMRKKNFGTSNPVVSVEGWSKKAHCAGKKKKTEDVNEDIDVSTQRGRLAYYLKQPDIKKGMAIHLGRLPKYHDGKDELADMVPDRVGVFALHPDAWEST